MVVPSPHLCPDRWIRQIFASRAAADGGVVRRSARDVERLVGRDLFEAELRRRGFQAVENAGQYVIFCNSERIQVVVQSEIPKI